MPMPTSITPLVAPAPTQSVPMSSARKLALALFCCLLLGLCAGAIARFGFHADNLKSLLVTGGSTAGLMLIASILYKKLATPSVENRITPNTSKPLAQQEVHKTAAHAKSRKEKKQKDPSARKKEKFKLPKVKSSEDSPARKEALRLLDVKSSEDSPARKEALRLLQVEFSEDYVGILANILPGQDLQRLLGSSNDEILLAITRGYQCFVLKTKCNDEVRTEIQKLITNAREKLAKQLLDPKQS